MLRHSSAASMQSRSLPNGAAASHPAAFPSSQPRRAPHHQASAVRLQGGAGLAHGAVLLARRAPGPQRPVARSSAADSGAPGAAGGDDVIIQPVVPVVVPSPTLASALEPPAVPLPAAAAAVPPAPKGPNFFRSLFRSLQDYGVGRRALAEGSTGLFILIGGSACFALVAWAKGQALRTGAPYQATIDFPLACGVTVGTPLRMRGVQVGTVLNVRSSLSKVDVLVEVNDVSTVIPKNALIEANQSGLIAEPLLDITPQLPLPAAGLGPMDANCEEQGAVLCNNGRMSGRVGVSLDDLVYIMTRMARQADAEGLDKIFATAEAATAALKEAEPLLQQASLLVEQVTPLLKELREGGLVANLENMTLAAADAAADIHRLQAAVMTDENVKALRQTVLTLCKTLEHVESISGDVSVFSRDTGVQRNLKVLVQALSRLVDE